MLLTNYVCSSVHGVETVVLLSRHLKCTIVGFSNLACGILLKSISSLEPVINQYECYHDLYEGMQSVLRCAILLAGMFL